jgi:hypothetical protein
MTLLMLVAVTAMADGRGPDGGAQPTDQATLSGAWKATFTAEEGGPPPFSVLILFTRDGGVVETDAGPPNPLQFSPGIGEWKGGEHGHVIINYTQLQYDGGQNQIGVFRGAMDVTVNGNSINGTVKVSFYDLNDVLLFEGAGTVAGTRIGIK